MESKSKLNPVIVILGVFLFKVIIVDNFRFHNNNAADSQLASKPKTDKTLVAIR